MAVTPAISRHPWKGKYRREMAEHTGQTSGIPVIPVLVAPEPERPVLFCFLSEQTA